jgi:hypothetical chaperone protein
VKFERLLDLVRFNYSYNCFQAIRRAKIELSERESTEIDIPELNLRIPFTRATFESLLEKPLADTRRLIEGLLGELRLQPSDISVVIRTGGTSQIVAVRALLDSLFPGKVVGHDPFTSVAGGLAIANHAGYRWP